MADKLLTVVITMPDNAPGDEAERIRLMLGSGMIDRVHIRKPDWSAERIGALIRAVGPEMYRCLSIHSCPELLEAYPGVGYHFSASRPAPVQRPAVLSRSCHTPEEVCLTGAECDYVTLSPVFDSISKHGYRAAVFDIRKEYATTRTALTVALGGVKPEHFGELRSRGYRGAAMLGHAWTTPLQEFLNQLKCYNS
ncbi:MAG: thiamine phosphate synthase [Muribaculaceae bacterium]|nr:thiamine phosphate synthase [Muribaculaceae bacterium]